MAEDTQTSVLTYKDKEFTEADLSEEANKIISRIRHTNDLIKYHGNHAALLQDSLTYQNSLLEQELEKGLEAK